MFWPARRTGDSGDREDYMTQTQKTILVVCSLLLFFTMTVSSLHAIDSDLTRRTLLGLKGVSVAVENPQPNIQKYAQRFGLTKDQLQKDIEQRLTKAGINVLNQEKWLQTSGRPVVYVVVNTHEFEKYWYSYTIIVDLMQITTLEANSDIKTLASTWSINMAGIANIGTLNTIKDNVNLLVDRFIKAYLSVNRKEPISMK
jgi:hypothetical protein